MNAMRPRHSRFYTTEEENILNDLIAKYLKPTGHKSYHWAQIAKIFNQMTGSNRSVESLRSKYFFMMRKKGEPVITKAFKKEKPFKVTKPKILIINNERLPDISIPMPWHATQLNQDVVEPMAVETEQTMPFKIEQNDVNESESEAAPILPKVEQPEENIETEPQPSEPVEESGHEERTKVTFQAKIETSATQIQDNKFSICINKILIIKNERMPNSSMPMWHATQLNQDVEPMAVVTEQAARILPKVEQQEENIETEPQPNETSEPDEERTKVSFQVKMESSGAQIQDIEYSISWTSRTCSCAKRNWN